MADKYSAYADLFKILAEANRLIIIDMLSCGELCACKILERFNITQPTLSHHMKALSSRGLVNARKEGKWMYYSLNQGAMNELKFFLNDLSAPKEDCICR